MSAALHNGKQGRQRLIVPIVATWKKLRTDLAHDAQELRASRLDFAAKVLGIEPIESLTELNAAQLGRVLDALRAAGAGGRGLGSEETVQGSRFRAQGSQSRPPTPGPRPLVVHLASNSQVWAIGRILDYLGWTEEGRAGFFEKNFKGVPARMLKAKGPKSADSAITILLGMAASRDIKRRLGEATKVSRAMMHQELPALKERIGLGGRI